MPGRIAFYGTLIICAWLIITTFSTRPIDPVSLRYLIIAVFLLTLVTHMTLRRYAEWIGDLILRNSALEGRIREIASDIILPGEETERAARKNLSR
jgi:hypothetical protein